MIYIFFLLIILFIIIILTSIRMEVSYLYENAASRYFVSIFAFRGFLKYKIGNPSYKNKRAQKKGKKKDGGSIKKSLDTFYKLKYKKINAKKDINKRRFSYKNSKKSITDSIIENIEKLKNYYYEYKFILISVMNFIRYKIKIDKLSMEVVIGTGNSHYTAILTGVVWSFYGILLSLLTNLTEVNKKEVDIKADFTNKNFKVNINCILKVKIGHIIVILFLIFADIISKKLGFKGINYQSRGFSHGSKYQ